MSARQPSVYERVEIVNRRSEYMAVPTDLAGIHDVAEWVESKGAMTADVGLDGFRYQNEGDDEWRWVNTGQWMHHYNGIEFDHPNDSAPWDLSAMEHISGPVLTEDAS